MLRRDLVRCQSWYAVDSRIDCLNERRQFVYVAIRPFALQTFVDDVSERLNIALCKCRLCFTVCGVSVDVFGFTELFESAFELGSFIRPYFQWFSFGDHATKTFKFPLHPQFAMAEIWIFVTVHQQRQKVFNTIVVFSQLVYISQLNRPDLIDIISNNLQTG